MISPFIWQIQECFGGIITCLSSEFGIIWLIWVWTNISCSKHLQTIQNKNFTGWGLKTSWNNLNQELSIWHFCWIFFDVINAAATGGQRGAVAKVPVFRPGWGFGAIENNGKTWVLVHIICTINKCNCILFFLGERWCSNFPINR